MPLSFGPFGASKRSLIAPTSNARCRLRPISAVPTDHNPSMERLEALSPIQKNAVLSSYTSDLSAVDTPHVATAPVLPRFRANGALYHNKDL